MTKAEQAKRYLELAEKLPEIAYGNKVPAELIVDEIAAALRRLAEIDSGSGIQNLIDELRKQLPGCEIKLELYLDHAAGRIDAETEDEYDGSSVSFGNQFYCDVETPDEALQLLRQRLGLSE